MVSATQETLYFQGGITVLVLELDQRTNFCLIKDCPTNTFNSLNSHLKTLCPCVDTQLKLIVRCCWWSNEPSREELEAATIYFIIAKPAFRMLTTDNEGRGVVHD